MNLQPLRDQVLVRPAQHTEKSAGGIYLPTEEIPSEGEVLAVGSGFISENGMVLPLEVSVGDVVVFAKRAGTELKIEGEKYLVMHERDILAVKRD